MVLHRCRSPIHLSCALLAAVSAALPSQAQTVYRASVSTGAAEADWDSGHPSISADGRYIAFTSGAFNLVSGGAPDTTDVYVRDRVTQQTTCVSVSTTGVRGNASSDSGSISADGRFVAFRSYASNLAPNDTNGVEDIFLRDRVLNTTVLVSAGPGGLVANGWSDSPAISADGAVVTYSSKATNIASGAVAGVRNALAWSRTSGTSVCVSKAFDGAPANGDSFLPAISADGRLVAYASLASNIVLGDTNNASDIFVTDRLTGHSECVSVTSTGTQGETDSDNCAISGDGRFVAFRSYATNLVANPDNNDQPDLYLFDRVTRQTTLVSVGLTGATGLGESNAPALSNSGRFVAFWSKASDLVLGDVNAWYNVYLRDNVTQRTSRISTGNFWSVDPSITSDGVYVAFESYADSLVTGDTNQMSDVYVGGPLSAAYTLYDAQRALRIAGGLIVADAMDMPRSNVVAGNRIDILDASRIARKAMGLDP